MKKIFVLCVSMIFVLSGSNIVSGTKNMEKTIMEKDLSEYEKATFAGGCFWCMEHQFEELPGVLSVVSGYIGGDSENPTYKEVSTGNTGHMEAVEIAYDPKKVNYSKLIDVFLRQIDPTDAGGSFVDRGPQYASAIFYHSAEQKLKALKSIDELSMSGRFDNPIVVKIVEHSSFYKAEDYHQDYYKENPIRYKFYRSRSGRDQFIKNYWDNDLLDKVKYKKPIDSKLKKILTPLQYKVTQKGDTETPYKNEYWDNKKEGIYVDIVSGEPLFSSKDKFDSNTGWPSFTKPLNIDSLVERKDYSFFSKRVEVKSKIADSHLGHIFTDGPFPTGLRYCINSASLSFIPKEKLKAKGYVEFVGMFMDEH